MGKEDKKRFSMLTESLISPRKNNKFKKVKTKGAKKINIIL